MIGFCTSPRFVEHQTGPHHPERPDRIRAIFAAVRAAKLVTSPNPFADFSLELGPLPQAQSPMLELEPAPAERRWIELIHPPKYLDYIEHVCQSGGGVLDQGDTP